MITFFFKPVLLHHRLEIKRRLKGSLKKGLHVLVHIHITMSLAKDVRVERGKPLKGIQEDPEIGKAVRRNVPRAQRAAGRL
jgi:hypothetical protein